MVGPSNVQWFRTDEVADVLSSLREIERAWNATADDPLAWKWVVLSLHSALQGALVCHLTGPANLGALEEGPKFVKWLAWKQDHIGQRPKEPKVARFSALVERVQRSERIETAGGVVSLSVDELWAIDLLSNFRDQFTHYRPQGWSIEISGMPKIVSAILRLVGRIDKDGWAFRHASDEERAELRAIIQRLS